MKRLFSLILATILALITAASGSAATLPEILADQEQNLKTVNEKLPALVDFTVNKFRDTAKDTWYINSVSKLTGLGGIDGYPDSTFQPDGTITTAEFTKLLLAGMGYRQNITGSNWYDNYVAKAKDLGVIESVDNYEYNGGMKRAYMAKMICKMLKLEPKKSSKSIFSDTGSKDTSWIDTAFEQYLIRGYYSKGQRTFMPDQTATRAEVSEMIVRALEYRQDPQQYKVEKEAYFKELEQKQDKTDELEQSIQNGTLHVVNGFIAKILLKNTGVDVEFDEQLSKTYPGRYPILSITLDFNIAAQFSMDSQYKDTEDILLQKFSSQFTDEVLDYVKSAKFRKSLAFKEFYPQEKNGYWIGVGASYSGIISVDIYEDVR